MLLFMEQIIFSWSSINHFETSQVYKSIAQIITRVLAQKSSTQFLII